MIPGGGGALTEKLFKDSWAKIFSCALVGSKVEVMILIVDAVVKESLRMYSLLADRCLRDKE